MNVDLPSARPSVDRTICRLCCAALSALAGSAVLVQFYLSLLGAGGTVGGVFRTTVVFFSFFTILSNTAVAIAAGRVAWRSDGVFARPRGATAIAVNLTVVLVIYELLLRRLWDPRGLALVIDTIFHDVVPLATVGLWAACVPKGTLRPRDAGPWLVAPATYGLWVGVLGAMTGDAPYPFLNVRKIGGGRVAINVLGLIAVFWVVGLCFVAIDGWLGRRRAKN